MHFSAALYIQKLSKVIQELLREVLVRGSRHSSLLRMRCLMSSNKFNRASRYGAMFDKKIQFADGNDFSSQLNEVEREIDFSFPFVIPLRSLERG